MVYPFLRGLKFQGQSVRIIKQHGHFSFDWFKYINTCTARNARKILGQSAEKIKRGIVKEGQQQLPKCTL